MEHADVAARATLSIQSFLLYRIFWEAVILKSQIHFLVLSEILAFYYGVAPRSAAQKRRCASCTRFNQVLLNCELYKDQIYDHSASFHYIEKSAAAGCDVCRYLRAALITNVASYAQLKASSSPIMLGITLAGLPNEPPGSVRLKLIHGTEAITNIYASAEYDTTTRCKRSQAYDTRRTALRLHRVLDIIQELKIARRWLRDCLQNHDECMTGLTNDIPTRLLDVGDAEKRPTLFTTKNAHWIQHDQGGPVRYCALSYCWGPEGGHGRTVGLTRANMSRYTDGLPWDSLPKTIQDAIIITRCLGVRYLWVDAICIIQPNTGDDADWYSESSRMCEIYRNAVCTISAQGAQDAGQGCFLERSWKLYPLRPCALQRTRTSAGKLWPFVLPPVIPTGTSIDRAPLNHRAWTFQERYLSSRVLYWTKDAIFWECRSCRQSYPAQPQNGPKGSDGTSWKDDHILQEGIISRARLQNIGDDIWMFWINLAIDFSHRRIRVSTDRLVALSGIVKALQPYLGSRYLAGLWRTALPYDLLWYYTDDIVNLDQATCQNVYVAPSWSWTSRPHPFMFVLGSLDILPGIEVNDKLTFLEYSSADPYGGVRDGQLCIKGPLLQVVLASPTALLEREQTAEFVCPPCHPDGVVDIIFDEKPFSPLERLFCLIIAWSREDGYHALLLQAVAGPTDVYRRTAMLKIHLGGDSDCHNMGDLDSHFEPVREILIK